MAQRVAGICYFKVDGAQYSARGQFEWQPLTTSKEGVVGVDGIHGFKEIPLIPTIKGNITDLGGVSVQALQALTDSTVTIEAANGKVITLSDAWVKGGVTVNAVEGSYEVTFEGLTCTEETSS